jgi:hypothetical protein
MCPHIECAITLSWPDNPCARGIARSQVQLRLAEVLLAIG